MNSPAKHNIPGAKTLWDELHYVHIYQSAYIHFVAAFLPFHRYYLAVHSKLLRKDCGYRGPMPSVLSTPFPFSPFQIPLHDQDTNPQPQTPS